MPGGLSRHENTFCDSECPSLSAGVCAVPLAWPQNDGACYSAGAVEAFLAYAAERVQKKIYL